MYKEVHIAEAITLGSLALTHFPPFILAEEYSDN